MNKFVLRFGLASFLAITLAITLAGTPKALQAQQTPPPLPVTPRKTSTHVTAFRGFLKEIDNKAKTISIGKETIQITSETKITRGGKPATLNDGAVGDLVGGAYRKDADGKLNAVSLRFAPKPTPESGETKTNKTNTS